MDIWIPVSYTHLDVYKRQLQAYGFPAQFVLMMPYIVTVAVLAVSMALKMGASKKRESSLMGKQA